MVVLEHPTIFQGICTFFCCPKESTKENAVLPAAPTTCGDCADFDRTFVFFSIHHTSLFLSKKALPPSSGPSPSVGRASRTARQRPAGSEREFGPALLFGGLIQIPVLEGLEADEAKPCLRPPKAGEFGFAPP